MPIPDEKARAWTRPEDYWPPRRIRRKSKAPPAVSQFASPRDGGQPAGESRPLLGLVPYGLLMLSLALLAAAIIVLAWPGRSTPPPQPAPRSEPIEVGTAPPGWMKDER